MLPLLLLFPWPSSSSTAMHKLFSPLLLLLLLFPLLAASTSKPGGIDKNSGTRINEGSSGKGGKKRKQEQNKKKYRQRKEMDPHSPSDEETGSSQLPQPPDLDTCWRSVLHYIPSNEKDCSMHVSEKYQNPAYVYMSSTAWRRLVETEGACHAVELMLGFGFVPDPEGVASLSGWIECEAASTGTQPDDTNSTAEAADFTAFLLPAITNEKPDGNRGVRFQVMRHKGGEGPFGTIVGRTLPPVTAVPRNQSDSPTPSCQGGRSSETSSKLAGPSHLQPSARGAVSEAPPSASGNEPMDSFSAASSKEAEGSSVPHLHLEAQVKELKRQVRFLKLQKSGAHDGVAIWDGSLASLPTSPTRVAPSSTSQQLSTQEPHITIHHDVPLVASTSCQTPVWLSVSYLDPDCAPYVVSLGTGSSRTLLACATAEQRFVFFVAPPCCRGRRPVDLLCTRDGTLHRYAGPVWLDYRAQDPPNTLTHHAVNQLLQDIPLPTSTVSVDAANLSEAELAKSESVFDDDNTGCDTDTAATVSELGFESEPRLPLTKEMLRFIQNGALSSSIPRRRRVGTSAVESSSTGGVVDADRDGVEDGDEDDGDAAAARQESQASQTWRGSTRADVLGSTLFSTGHQTSCVHGPHSVRSDEEATQSAFPYTELSSSSMTSVLSHESVASTAAGIMVRRGWVRT
ncbi:hypothetical protein, conserved [Trypanosoma brucei gambiense DAL972]|uniref:T. brucei spp.-specific protein n=1 Tax=Trypanosoma brucei gambiense (strain MHOM/CI/86/DAL972) TaxID=679716 RepID=C9ZQ75_TRYB9|nr:hypothetical protein, conserved [Trypanosoma brucei gambiense DAL972]CBH11555.1 hypothetical protein, conserved [Trypanosoma brucei gambiense DAL972]|eukprot:XP_011773840.1 hypothetical protein, conserved [Trypanosoma brucei gambiense DAL972]